MKIQLKLIFALAIPLLLVLAAPSMAAEAAASVAVSDAYVRAVAPGQTSSAAYMKLSNGGSDAHAVVGAESPAAEVVELHTHMEMDGMMKMRQVEKIDIGPNGETLLQPGGLHVMLMGLKEELKDGSHAMVTLIFEDGSKKMVHAPVRKMEMKMKMDMEGGHQH